MALNTYCHFHAVTGPFLNTIQFKLDIEVVTWGEVISSFRISKHRISYLTRLTDRLKGLGRRVCLLEV